MSFSSRKPQTLMVSTARSPSGDMIESYRTPILPKAELASLNSPLPQKPSMAITPDTWDLRYQQEIASWTESQDELIQQYLDLPPRPLTESYPPGSLPPPPALDNITTQIMSDAPWSKEKTFVQVRRRLVEIHRKTAKAAASSSSKLSPGDAQPIEPIHGRQIFTTPTGMGTLEVSTEELDPEASDELGPWRGQVRVMGGEKMNRQQHSMDQLYGDNVVGLDAKRLSSTLQVNAAGSLGLTSMLASDCLASPLDTGRKFHFSFPDDTPEALSSTVQPETPQKQKPAFFRTRSFTEGPTPLIPFTIKEDTSPMVTEPSSPVLNGHPGSLSLNQSPVVVRPEMTRSVSSPVSTFATSPPTSGDEVSPPSSLSSATSSQVRAILIGKASISSIEALTNEPAPFTPLEQVFPQPLAPPPAPRVPGRSARWISPAFSSHGPGNVTPAIMLTSDSPPSPDTTEPVSRFPTGHDMYPAVARPASPGMVSAKLADMSIDHPSPASQGAKIPTNPQTGRAMPHQMIRAPALSRSYSEGTRPRASPYSALLNSASLIPVPQGLMQGAGGSMQPPPMPSRPATRGAKELPGPLPKRQRGNARNLLITTARVSGSGRELRSPFVPKATFAYGPDEI